MRIRGFKNAWLSILILAAGLLVTGAAVQAASARLKVIATIRPLHSLVAGVMQGVGVPKLLIRSGSPHSYALKPSDAGALVQAQAVFWIGPNLENFLEKPLKSLASGAELVALGRIGGLKLLEVRSGAGGHDHDHKTDMHIWLDPDNAGHFIRQIVSTLSHTDPANAEVYEANGAYQLKRLAGLSREIEDMLAPLSRRQSIFYHDAFQYFERRFGLKSAGFVSAGPFRAPGARHIRRLRKAMKSGTVSCILTEPQFASALVPMLAENTKARIGVLDPIGAGWQPGPDLYFNMMRKNAMALHECLAE